MSERVVISEDDYIQVSNLAKLRIAREVLSGVFCMDGDKYGMDESDLAEFLEGLAASIARLEDRMSGQ